MHRPPITYGQLFHIVLIVFIYRLLQPQLTFYFLILIKIVGFQSFASHALSILHQMSIPQQDASKTHLISNQNHKVDKVFNHAFNFIKWWRNIESIRTGCSQGYSHWTYHDAVLWYIIGEMSNTMRGRTIFKALCRTLSHFRYSLDILKNQTFLTNNNQKEAEE